MIRRSLPFAAAALVLAGCSAGEQRAPSAPPVSVTPTPAPTPAPTATTLDVLPCVNQRVSVDRVPPGTRVIDLIVPDTITIWPDRTIGFPNGRLLNDPVVDITLAIALLDVNSAGQNTRSFADRPLNPPRATQPPLADFPFANLPNDNPVLDTGNGTGFVFDTAPMSAYVQVDRMGMPAVATALILGPRKTAYSDGNVQLDTANTYAFDLIEGLRVFSEPLQDDLTALGLRSCAVRRAT